MSRPPQFDELFGDDVDVSERERLRGAHELLVQAGPPPELDPLLEQPPAPWLPGAGRERGRPRSRSRVRTALVAAALALTAFLVGTLVGGGGGGNEFEAARIVQLRGTDVAPNAEAAISIGRRDEVGNWPMLLRVRGLRQQPPDGYYTLALVRDGEARIPCGTFRVTGRRLTTVRLNAPYEWSKFEGWAVTEFKPNGTHDLERQRVVLVS